MDNEKLVAALGFFDGVHIAHGALLEKTAAAAKKMGAVPAAVIFDRSPVKTNIELLNTVEDRKFLIKSIYGIDRTIELKFTDDMMRTPWDKFARELVKEHNVCGFVAGYDFTFGYKGEGNSEKLKEISRQMGVFCEIVDKIELDGIAVSSTYVRSLLKDGDVKTANKFLGHRHILTAEIVTGKQLGRTIGVPTANMLIPEGVITPKNGVYAALFYMPDGRHYRAVTNIGVRPTVSGVGVTVESFVLDFSGDLYGKTCRVELLDFIRPEQKFSGLDELKAQISRDAESAANTPL